jgi:hypothetical protein
MLSTFAFGAIRVNNSTRRGWTPFYIVDPDSPGRTRARISRLFYGLLDSSTHYIPDTWRSLCLTFEKCPPPFSLGTSVLFRLLGELTRETRVGPARRRGRSRSTKSKFVGPLIGPAQIRICWVSHVAIQLEFGAFCAFNGLDCDMYI